MGQRAQLLEQVAGLPGEALKVGVDRLRSAHRVSLARRAATTATTARGHAMVCRGTGPVRIGA